MKEIPNEIIIHFKGKSLYLNLPDIICYGTAKEVLATLEDIIEIIQKKLSKKGKEVQEPSNV
jgi:hypothetical protein